MLAAGAITRNTRVKQDSAMGIILAVFFGTGVFILNLIQRSTIRNKSGLDDYIFGSAATMTQDDVLAMAILGALALIIMSIFWKELKAHTFDSNFSDTIGISYSVMNPLLLGLIVVSIVIGLQAVGVILMVSMIIAPAASARQWTDNLVVMVLLAAFFGALAGITGAIVSGTFTRVPTGPVVILTITSIFLFSLLFAPKRGLLTALVKRLNSRRHIMLSLVLSDLYFLKANHNYNRDAGHPAKVISMMRGRNYNVEKSLKVLRTLGLVTNDSRGNWILTSKGVEKARGVVEKKGEMV
jgi:manganese/zinc/iron transport system permease protein